MLQSEQKELTDRIDKMGATELSAYRKQLRTQSTNGSIQPGDRQGFYEVSLHATKKMMELEGKTNEPISMQLKHQGRNATPEEMAAAAAQTKLNHTAWQQKFDEQHKKAVETNAQKIQESTRSNVILGMSTVDAQQKAVKDHPEPERQIYGDTGNGNGDGNTGE